MNLDPESRDLLYQFVSSLIVKTKKGEMQWYPLDPKESVFGPIHIHPTKCAAVYVAETPDDKKLHFLMTRCQLRLVNEQASNKENKIELDMLPSGVNLLKNLRDTICEQAKSTPQISPAAEQTIDLILNANKETASR